jgi:hypothetical protein
MYVNRSPKVAVAVFRQWIHELFFLIHETENGVRNIECYAISKLRNTESRLYFKNMCENLCLLIFEAPGKFLCFLVKQYKNIGNNFTGK